MIEILPLEKVICFVDIILMHIDVVLGLHHDFVKSIVAVFQRDTHIALSLHIDLLCLESDVSDGEGLVALEAIERTVHTRGADNLFILTEYVCVCHGVTFSIDRENLLSAYAHSAAKQDGGQ